MIGTVRDRHQQRRALIWTAVASLATGNTDRWNAGSDLMYAANPEDARNLVYTSIMLEENAEAILACREAARQAGTAQKCQVSVPAPAR